MLERIERNDPTLTELVILPTKTFGSTEVNRLAVALGPNGKNTYLTSISASGHEIQDVSSLASLGKAISSGTQNNVKSLAIGNSTMGDVGVCALCDGLQQGCWGGDDNYDGTSRIRLEYLDLSYKNIGSLGMNAIIETFQGSSTLKTLNLSRNPNIGSCTIFQQQRGTGEEEEGDANSTAKQFLPSVTDLDLSECGMTSQSCEGLVSELAQSNNNNNNNDDDDDDLARNLTLRLNSNPQIGPNGMKFLSRALTTTTSSSSNACNVVQLYLSRCNILDEGLTYLLDGISDGGRSSSYLQVLDLSYNDLTSVGLEEFSKRLIHNNNEDDVLPQLVDLNLAGSKFNEESSITSFAKALDVLYYKKRTSSDNDDHDDGKVLLSKLDLNDTSCGIQGAISMIKYGHLQSLSLFNNDLNSEGFIEIADSGCLHGGHPTLKSLDIGGNHANQGSVVALLESLIIKEKDDTTPSTFTKNQLELLVVGGNEGGPDVEEMVKKVKEVFPKLDIARDKPRRQQNQQN